jgi:hypothetical protein
MEKININPKFLLRVDNIKPYYILSKSLIYTIKIDKNTHLKKVYIKLIENLYEK